MFRFNSQRRFVTQMAALSTLAMTAVWVQAGNVVPPPLPPGSNQVKIDAGQSPDERNRMLRAHKHHHPLHVKKDLTRDDTMDDDHEPGKAGSKGQDGEKNDKPQSR